jgi:hypothetical protein
MATRLIALPLALCVLALAPATAAATSRVVGDYNGDGRDDLAVGVPDEDFGALATHSGAVNVIYGSASRLSAEGNQFWDQDSMGINDAVETNDEFGFSLAAGDFNGDGFDDLAVGVPNEDIGSIGAAGAVNVLYGSASGLTAAGNQLWHQDSVGIFDDPEGTDQFGSALTAGDFDGSGHDDLAVGVPGEDIGSIGNAGAVNVLYGTASGLTESNDQFAHQDTPLIVDAVEPDDDFGSSLTAGDFDGSGHDELAIGAPGEDVGSIQDAGAVNVLFGSPDRLTVVGNQLWHQDSTGIADAAESGDDFGQSLGAGDFNGSGHDDLAVGVPDEGVGSLASAGAVNVLYGAGVGLRAPGNQFWHQDSTGIADAAESVDDFAFSLAAGDFNASGHDDLAVGVRNEDVGPTNVGAVNMLYGSETRLTADGNQLWHQDSTGIADTAELGDVFGSSLTVGDFNASGHDDLAVGVPLEDIGSTGGAGAVNVLYGAGVGLRATGNQFWHQDSTGIADTAQGVDRFGFALPN